MSNEQGKQEAFEAIQELALRGKAFTKDEKLKAILDDIHALARYQFDVVNHKGRNA